MRTGHCAHVGLCNKRVHGSCCGSHRLLSVPGVQRCAQWLWVCIVAVGVHSSGCAQWLRVYMVSVGVHSGGCTAQWCAQWPWVCTVVGMHSLGVHSGRCA